MLDSLQFAPDGLVAHLASGPWDAGDDVGEIDVSMAGQVSMAFKGAICQYFPLI